MLLISAFTSRARAVVELQSNFLPSVALVGRGDLVFSSHNTLLVGGSWFRIGAYGSFETISQNVVDQSYGGALRIGQDSYLELQGGYFQRRFSQQSTHLQGRGYAANLVFGTHLNDYFGLAFFLSGKRIASGELDKRWIVDLLPFLTMRVEF